MNQNEFKENQFKGAISGVSTLEVKKLTDDGEFEGYAAVYGNVDKGGDIVAPGAFDESLRKRPASKVKMLLHHDTRRIVGVWSQMVSETRGLFAKGKLLLSTTDGRETYELLKAEAMDGLSIGYRTNEYEYDRDHEVRTITKADLMEVSLVTFPMNEMAMISAVKGERGIKTARDFELFLREEGGFTHQQAKMIAIHGFKSSESRDGTDESSEPRDEAGTLTDLLDSLKRIGPVFN